jgi:putative SOS response-associated peptidase YedK
MTPYHDRMTVLLAGAAIEVWLNGSLGPEGLKPAAETPCANGRSRNG